MSPGRIARLVFLLFGILIVIVGSVPITRTHDVEAEMRQTPQNHCLRFRKFDMIRRCRSFVRRVRRHSYNSKFPLEDSSGSGFNNRFLRIDQDLAFISCVSNLDLMNLRCSGVSAPRIRNFIPWTPLERLEKPT
ncbi:hypothetical protein GE061_015271 [Apolygus lucorum]|uniref:Uncharacterized protein n=1 Tax=Apolygus lucorum TaxID=248454 RepID=A0A8S9XKL9_APOLU|nr:hypothetical protein GE061_015271 [Apolygus lucorum]